MESRRGCARPTISVVLTGICGGGSRPQEHLKERQLVERSMRFSPSINDKQSRLEGCSCRERTSKWQVRGRRTRYPVHPSSERIYGPDSECQGLGIVLKVQVRLVITAQ